MARRSARTVSRRRLSRSTASVYLVVAVLLWAAGTVNHSTLAKVLALTLALAAFLY